MKFQTLYTDDKKLRSEVLQSSLVIARDLNASGAKEYETFDPDTMKILPRIISSKQHRDRNYHEVLMPKTRRKLYMDLETIVPGGSLERNDSRYWKVQSALSEILTSEFGLKDVHDQLFMFDGSRLLDSGDFKFSLHFVLNGYYTCEPKVLEHMAKVCAKMMSTTSCGLPFTIGQTIDLQVYKPVQCFRLPYCTKYGSDVPLVPIGDNVYDDTTDGRVIEDYLWFGLIHDSRDMSLELDVPSAMTLCPMPLNHTKLNNGPNVDIVELVDKIEIMLNDISAQAFAKYENWQKIVRACANLTNKSDIMFDKLAVINERLYPGGTEQTRAMYESTDLDREAKYGWNAIMEVLGESDLSEERLTELRNLITASKPDRDIYSTEDDIMFFELCKLTKSPQPLRELVWRARQCIFVVANNGHKFYVVKEKNQGEVSFTIRTQKELDSNKFKIATKTKTGLDKVVIRKLSDIVLEDERIFKSAEFNPFSDKAGRPAEDSEILNTWQGFNHKYNPTFESEEGAIGVRELLDHIEKYICGGRADAFKYALDWMANIVQNPTKPNGTLMLFKSEQGVGKNLIFERLFGNGILGRKNVVFVSKMQDLTAKFNSSLENKLFVCMDEVGITSTDGPSNDYMKTLIRGGDYIKIERKGIDAGTMRNRLNFAAFTNHNNVFRIESGDTRFAVIESDSSICRLDKDKNFDYFARLWKFAENADVQQLFYNMLCDRDITRYLPKNMPASELKDHIQEYSVPPVAQYINDVITEGRYIAGMDASHKIAYNELYTDYMQHCERLKIKPIKKLTFRGELADYARIYQCMINGVRTMGLEFDSEKMRIAVNEKLGREYIKNLND